MHDSAWLINITTDDKNFALFFQWDLIVDIMECLTCLRLKSKYFDYKVDGIKMSVFLSFASTDQAGPRNDNNVVVGVTIWSTHRPSFLSRNTPVK